jgi:hypothetical protein
VNLGITVSGGDGAFAHIDQTDGLIQISSAQYNNYYRSIDGGNTFLFQGSISNARGLFINASDYDDGLNILYAGDEPSQYYVVSNWAATTPSATVKTVPEIGISRQVSAVKVDPFTPNTVWMGTTTADDTTILQIPTVLKISSANTTPVVVVSTALPVAAGSTVSSIDVDSANANHILVTLSNYGVTSVLESTNGGQSFSSIEGNLPDMPVRWGIFAPSTALLNGAGNGTGGILLGTELGVWTTSKISGNTTTWIANNGNLPNVRTDMLRYRALDGTLVAATHGRGIFTTSLTTPGTTDPPAPTNPAFIRYISTTADNLLIVTGSSAAATINVRIFDAAGRLVYDRQRDYSTNTISLLSLSRGMYILQVRSDKGEVYTRKFTRL